MMENPHTIVSQVVTFHSETVLAHFALAGLARLRNYADRENVQLEYVLVLDRADPLTKRIVNNHPLLRDIDQIIEVDHGDPGLSRNSGVAAARGEYIGIIDGDDYLSENWIIAAITTLNSSDKPVVVHPELQVTFGVKHFVAHPIDMSRDKFSSFECFSDHPWITASFSKKEIYAQHPFLPTDVQKTGFGHEDWHWNVELLAHGLTHVCAPKTAVYYRSRTFSQLVRNNLHGAIIRPSAFFDQVDAWVEYDAGSHA